MAYALPAHNNPDSLWLKFLYSNTFQSPIDTIITHVSQSFKPI
jgi:hypothetical protein